jgi:uncharacterized protein (TIGR03437 family)
MQPNQMFRIPGFSRPWLGLSLAAAAAALFITSTRLPAQSRRVFGPIDNSNRIALRGHVNPRIANGTDLGRMDPSQVLDHVSIVFKQTPAQEADLEQLLANQQNPASPDYHKWLTPEQYADRFGASQADVDQLTSWLKQQNLTVIEVARGRNWVAFSGTVGDVEAAFATEIHRYQVDSRMHFANTTDPQIPAALEPLVGEIHGLHDFKLRAPKLKLAQYDSGRGGNTHYIAPDDIAAIYDVKPLLDSGVDGTGQKIVIIGQSNIDVSNIQQYRTYFNLPANTPQLILVPGQKDPGQVSGDVDESHLDIEIAGAVARNASIVFVYSGDVETSAQYAVNQNLAPVLSQSYGLCEAETQKSDAKFQEAMAKQGNAQGMTWINAAGDSGAADCASDDTARTGYGLQVDVPASMPEVTGIGGSTLAEGSGTYWATTNGPNLGSALSYIPETTWNDSAEDGTPSSGGGGASTLWLKPSWQTGPGVPADGARDVPDISFSASADHDAYMFYTGGRINYVGGTSVGTPLFAGVVALLNQYLISNGAQSGAGLGNVNPRLYALAQSAPSAFHDITTGNNMVNPCPPRARSCDSTPVGYNAGPGYDLATGLGSIDAYALISAWTGASNSIARSSATVALAAADNVVLSTDNATLTASVKASNGGTPTGTVTFLSGSTSLGAVNLVSGSGSATASLVVSASQLPVGSDTITAQYSGDSSYNAASASLILTIAAPPSGAPAILGLSNGASFKQSYAPGMIMSVFGNLLAPGTESASTLPLPVKLAGVTATVNGATAPLYFVSSGQLNVQIPYETPTTGDVTMTINNNGQTVSTTFRAAAAAPGIFTDSNGAPVPNTSLARGAVGMLFITGDGAVSPALATGATPAAGTPVSSLPKPVQNVTVTVGGVNAPIQFIGIPSGLAGVTQINYQVPSGLSTGPQPVVVTVGGFASQTATLTVQ